jgi:hypothetical protein
MRRGLAWMFALITLALPGCGTAFVEPSGAFLAVSAAAVPVFGRTVPDMVYSGLTGRDCSIVRLDQGRSYCRPVEPPIAPVPVCTRSLAVVECWSNPEAFGNPQHGVADAPAPTAEQEAYRTRRWPDF